MTEIDLLQSYIDKITIADFNDSVALDSLIEHITRTCMDESELQSLVLSYYMFDSIDYKSDLDKLKAKLLYKVSVLSDQRDKELKRQEVAKEEREIEKLKYQAAIAQSSIKVENINNNNSIANSSVNITITLTQTIEEINRIPNESLSKEDKDKLTNDLYALEGIKSTGDKVKFWDKAKDVIKYVADKGVDTGIALLPLIVQSLQSM